MKKRAKSAHLGEYANIASPIDGYSPFIFRFVLQEMAREILPHEKVAECLRKNAPLKTVVEIRKKEGSKHAHYSGLVVCSRIWFCAVCASRITEERRKDLHAATMSWLGGMGMATYTARHNKATTLPEILNGLLEAFRAFKSGKFFQEIKESYGWIGSVRTLEVTYGENGWHPHIHELVFFSNEIPIDIAMRLEFTLKQHWQAVLRRFGQTATHQRGLTLQTADSAIRDYVAKFGHEPIKTGWTVAHEITKQVTKTGKQDGRTPNQLLYDYWNGDIQARQIWKEYALTFKGRNQLVWSRGLRELLKMDKERTDEEIAEAVPEDAKLLATLTRSQWQGVLWANCVGEVLEKAGYMSESDFSQWLAALLEEWEHKYDFTRGAPVS